MYLEVNLPILKNLELAQMPTAQSASRCIYPRGTLLSSLALCRTQQNILILTFQIHATLNETASCNTDLRPSPRIYCTISQQQRWGLQNSEGRCPKGWCKSKINFCKRRKKRKKERKKETLPLLQQRAKLITCLFINEKIIISRPLVRQWMGQKNRELIYVCRSLWK